MRGNSLEGTLAALFVHGQTLPLFISNLQPKTQKQNWLAFQLLWFELMLLFLDSHQQQQLNVDLDLLHLFASHTAGKKREDLDSR